jgi:cellulose synthase/poly-beta-1,6-N-acetylglucosamine synthase-like glycosyltransferase
VAAVGECLRSGDEALVVDSASEDPQACRAAADAGFRIVRAARPGVSRARNLALAAATSAIVAFTDDDCRPRNDWPARVAAAFGDPGTAFVTGRAMPDSAGPVPVSVVVDEQPRSFRPGDDPFGCGAGANMAFRRDAVTEAGGFDEGLGPGTARPAAEDVDLFWRLLRRGWGGRFEPDSVVVHHQWRGRSQAIGQSWRYGLGGGALAVKAIRLEGRSGWRMLARRVGRSGLRQTGRDLRHGYASGALSGLLLTAGTVTGAARAARAPLAGERFGP